MILVYSLNRLTPCTLANPYIIAIFPQNVQGGYPYLTNLKVYGIARAMRARINNKVKAFIIMKRLDLPTQEYLHENFAYRDG